MPNNSARYRLKSGERIGNYRITHQLGQGWEREAYRVVEVPTGAVRAAKVWWNVEGLEIEQIVHSAQIYERLSDTEAVARYYLLGHLFHGEGGGSVYYSVFEYLDGETLSVWARRLRGGDETRASHIGHMLKILVMRMAVVHLRGLAVGDLATGENVIVLRENQSPVFCDLDTGTVGKPNSDYRNDLEELWLLAMHLHNLAGIPKMWQRLKPVFDRHREKKRVGRKSIVRLLNELEQQLG